jgi:hypothetical protein
MRACDALTLLDANASMHDFPLLDAIGWRQIAMR